jgi:aromatic amino acid aminotransferase I / 2-aminoadipate transaminase
LYTVPIGQNPSGLTTGADRKKEIYDICVEFDIIIGEDDPYYILQEGEYIPEDIRAKSKGKATTSNSDDIEEFIASLEPSYLKYVLFWFPRLLQSLISELDMTTKDESFVWTPSQR